MTCEICGKEIAEDNWCELAVQLVDDGENIRDEHKHYFCQTCAKAVVKSIANALYDDPEN